MRLPQELLASNTARMVSNFIISRLRGRPLEFPTFRRFVLSSLVNLLTENGGREFPTLLSGYRSSI